MSCLQDQNHVPQGVGTTNTTCKAFETVLSNQLTGVEYLLRENQRSRLNPKPTCKGDSWAGDPKVL
jgi:hypothetical protein